MIKSNMPGSKKINHETDPTLIRPSDPKDIYGDNSRLTNQTGWQPKIQLEQTLADFVKSKR